MEGHSFKNSHGASVQPIKKKQYADIYKEDKAAYPQKKKKKRKKKKANPKTQTVVPDQDSYSF